MALLITKHITGTVLHVVDPINPGAVDSIIHLGDYWNREGIQKNKFAIIGKNEEISGIYKTAYNYFGAAGKVYNNIRTILNKHLRQEEAYKNFAGLITKELSHKEINTEQGIIKKYFASAITADGYVNYTDSIIAECEHVYAVETEMGVDISKMLELFADSAMFRGFNVEAFYCPMSPEDRIEHLVIPDLSIAVATSNSIHNLKKAKSKKLEKIWFTYKADLGDATEQEISVLKNSREIYEILMKKGIECLKQAKQEHDALEAFYIPNMDFVKVEELRKNFIDSIE